VGERVVAAPEASADAFAADLWDNGVERAGDIAEAVQRLEGARGTIGSGLVDAAWSMELSTARATLASHGTGFFKIFSGDWRNANRLVRTVLTNPNQPLDETLSQLDALAEGQAARRAIENDETFARSAFGGDWRGDRSASTALFALVEWMRSLKGLGAEPRIVAAKRPDRDEIGMRLTRTEALLGEVLPVIDTLWCDLPSQEVIFGDALTAERADLSALLGTVSEFHAADQASTSVAVKVPTDLNLRLETLDDLAEGSAALQTSRTTKVWGNRRLTPVGGRMNRLGPFSAPLLTGSKKSRHPYVGQSDHRPPSIGAGRRHGRK
jgi:hypothetical protein